MESDHLFLKDKHTQYALALTKKEVKDVNSIGHYFTAHLRVAGGYWTALSLNVLKHAIPEEEKNNFIE